MNPVLYSVILVVAGALAGFINTLASSGSAVTLPLLMFMGVLAPVANGTNRVPILAGAAVAVWTFHRKKTIDWRGGLILAIPTVIGSICGALLASVLDAKKMGWAVTAAVVLAFLILMANPKRLLNVPAAGAIRTGWKNAIIFLFIGAWAGFIVLDSATYMLLGLVLGAGYDLIRANAIKSLLLLLISIVSLVIFTEKTRSIGRWARCSPSAALADRGPAACSR